MEFKQLQSFVAVVKYKSFSKNNQDRACCTVFCYNLSVLCRIVIGLACNSWWSY